MSFGEKLVMMLGTTFGLVAIVYFLFFYVPGAPSGQLYEHQRIQGKSLFHKTKQTMQQIRAISAPHTTSDEKRLSGSPRGLLLKLESSWQMRCLL